MQLARIIGSVVSTEKLTSLEGTKLLVMQPIDSSGKDVGSPIVGVDTVGAGIGDLVLVIYEGWAARTCFPTGNPLAPIETVIAGIIDEYVTDENTIYQK